MIRRHLPLLIPPKPLGGSALSFSPISFTSFISFPSSFLRTLPFSVHNIFPSNLFAFNPFRTLSEKHGGVYQLFPKWNIPAPAGKELWLSVPRITNHQLALFSSIPFPFFILHTLLHNGRSTTPFDSSASALFLSQRRCRGVVLVCLTKSFSACPPHAGPVRAVQTNCGPARPGEPATGHLPPVTHHLSPLGRTIDPRSGVRNVDRWAVTKDNVSTMTRKLSDTKLAVLGAGKLGGILLRAYLKQGLFAPKRVAATVSHAEKAAALSKDLAVEVGTDNRKAVKNADIILLCVKPQVIREVLEAIRPELTESSLVISVAASVPTSYIEQHLGAAVSGATVGHAAVSGASVAAAASSANRKIPVVRAMPNTCSTVGCGMTGICRGSHATPEHLEIARALFDAVGRTVVVYEKHMDAVTGLSASSPAFAYIILESLAEARVKVALARALATLLAAQ